MSAARMHRFIAADYQRENIDQFRRVTAESKAYSPLTFRCHQCKQDRSTSGCTNVAIANSRRKMKICAECSKVAA